VGSAAAESMATPRLSCTLETMTEIASIVFFAADGVRTAEFYRVAGVDLEDESHDEGPVHWAAEVGGVHVAVYDVADAGGTGNAGRAPGLRAAGSTFPGIYVPSLDLARAALEELGARVLEDHQVRPWGCRFIVEDPDGRAVEINQRSHCG
jgi:lactoylglutathione lyase